MAAPSATCELWLDGVRVPDTGPELLGGAPTALSGLALAWGRDGPNEQPGPATCVVDILDQSPAVDFLDQLHVGSDVQLWAEGRIPGAEDSTTWDETVDDPTMDSWPLGDAYASGYAGNAAGVVVFYPLTVVDSDSGRSLHLDNATTANNSTTGATMGPRKFSPPGTLPNAWDDIPQYQPTDDDWRLSASVLAPPGATVSLIPGTLSSPYVATFVGLTGSAPAPATGAWQTLTALGRSPVAGWLGLRVSVSGVRWRWQDQPAAATWADWQDPATTWETINLVLVDNISIERPSSQSSIRRVLVFSGAVSDVKAVPEGAGLLYTVTAADLGADLGNRVIGDDPWPVQTVATRADRVAQLAGITTSPRIRIDAPLGAVQVSARDVDAQPSYALLQDLATTAGGVLWAATHAVTGPFLWLENPDNRAAVAQLELVGGVIVITGQADDVTTISACDVLLDGVEWLQDTQDVATVVAVTWLEQGLDDDGQPTTTERTVTVVDTSPEAAPYGTRRLSISTELVNATDATALANRALVQARAVGWRVEGLTLDTATMPDALDSLDAATREISLLNLLDGTTRMGLALTLVDMPAYAPRGTVSSYYLEGGSYRFAGGAWALELAASPSAGQGSSATWAELDPAWTWTQWSPDIQWQDLYGVAA